MLLSAESLAISATAITAVVTFVTLLAMFAGLVSRLAKQEAQVDQLTTEIKELKEADKKLDQRMLENENCMRDLLTSFNEKVSAVLLEVRELKGEIKGREQTGRFNTPPSTR